MHAWSLLFACVREAQKKKKKKVEMSLFILCGNTFALGKL